MIIIAKSNGVFLKVGGSKKFPVRLLFVHDISLYSKPVIDN